MRTYSYFVTVLATAIALANAAPSTPPQNATSSAASSSVASTSASASETMASTSINMDFLKNSQLATLRPAKNPKAGARLAASPSATVVSKSAGRQPLSLYSPSSSSSSSSTSSSSTSTSSSAAPAQTSDSASDSGPDVGDFYVGANSYYLYSLPTADRTAVLDAMSSAGMKVVRIFITHIYYNNKGSGNSEVADLENYGVGQYDDTILRKIDQLMLECQQRGLKLIIACGDRYALGFWDTDQYALKYGIVSSGTSGAQQVFDASVFYTSNDAMSHYDKRIDHILQHKNALMGNTPWSQLDSVVHAFEPQNEPMGHMNLVSSSWTCDRAGRIKQNLPSDSGILITTGGGITTQLSLGSWAFTCDNFDIVSVHDYGTSASVTVAALVAAQQKAWDYGKSLLFEEWGALGWNKAATTQAFATGLANAGIPWLYWEITKPGKGASDYEVWTDEDTWGVLGDGSNTGASWRKRSLKAPLTKEKRASSVPATEETMAPGVQTENRFSKVKRSPKQHRQQSAHGRRIARHSSH